MFNQARAIQEEVVKQLEFDIENGYVAQSNLFYGKEFSGKLTCALDFVEALSKDNSDFSVLNTPSLFIFSSRNNKLRIDANLALWSKYSNTFFRKRVIKEIRIFLSQFQDKVSVLSAKENDALKINTLGDLLTEISQEKEYTSKEVADFISKLKALLQPIFKKFERSQGLSIDQIRLIQDWLQMSDGKTNKFVILENIETISMGAKNSLLKLLEEPPANSYIILISSVPNKLLDTILSRVRKYEFFPISATATNEILQNKYYSKGDNFYEFFLSSAYGDDFKEFENYSKLFVSAIKEGKRIDSTTENNLCQILDAYNTYDYFYSLVAKELKNLLMVGQFTPLKCKTIMNKFDSIIKEGQIYNQNSHNILERLIRECI